MSAVSASQNALKEMILIIISNIADTQDAIH